MKKSSYLMMVTAIILAACQPKTSPVDLNAEADAIRNLEGQWIEANQTKNVDKCMTLISPECTMMFPNEPTSAGLETIRKRIESMYADTTVMWETYTWTNDKVEVSLSGDLAYVRGTNIVKIKSKKGVVEDVGKGVDIWKKENGEWKTVLSIWNSDKPIEGQ